jgi:hypothetical protein
MNDLYEVPVSTLVDREITLPVPPDPRGIVVEAINAEGGMVDAYWPTEDGLWWSDRGVWRITWGQLVGHAFDQRLRLFVRQQGPRP